jgi:hypothetical protein
MGYPVSLILQHEFILLYDMRPLLVLTAECFVMERRHCCRLGGEKSSQPYGLIFTAMRKVIWPDYSGNEGTEGRFTVVKLAFPQHISLIGTIERKTKAGKL